MRGWIWFEPGELEAIWGKMFVQKWGYETQWETTVLLSLLASVVLGFSYAWWFGLLMLWGAKESLQALNHKKFFDPIP